MTDNKETIVVSFGILDDCQWCHGATGPFHTKITSMDKLKDTVRILLKNHKGHLNDIYVNVDGHDYCQITPDEIVDSLLRNKYFVINRVSKYYVVAFALNYTRFEIFSKDCDKQLIYWGVDNENAKKAVEIHQIKDENYNENPVVTLVKSLSKKA